MPVEGIITLDGAPVEGAAVLFAPESGRPATGVSDTLGRFRLTTIKPEDGAFVGRHRIAIVKQSVQGAPPPSGLSPTSGVAPVAKSLLPDKYSRFETSGISVEVVAGMTLVKLTLDSK